MSCCPGPKTGPEFDPDWEGPSEEDRERFGAETVACAECGFERYDDTPVCPRCGHVDEPGKRGTPVWAAVTAGAVAVGLVLLLVF